MLPSEWWISCGNSNVSQSPERFAIDGGLLAGHDGDGRWNNLGYWRHANNYSDACAALARLHGRVAGLSENHSVLELACGYGAGLDLWRQEFAVGSVLGLEYRQHCVEVINDARVIHGRFDMPFPESLGRGFVDAVVCVDAAYHARSLTAFLSNIFPVLKANGRLVFSTLVRSEGNTSFWSRQRNRMLLRLASMPDASVLPINTLQETLNQQGFDASFEDVSEDVFSGFSQWVRYREQQLLPDQRRSPAWLKIRFTARWCEALAADRSLRYMMVSATKRAPV